ncbi:multicopper oxidase domain-containing protein [Halovenus sp. HT40]|uniref:multicopper oxidase domain-containing protein n=1 Tax=Halovenus sp. HT40 TaxID=3126691 RepID=UPI00300F5B76
MTFDFPSRRRFIAGAGAIGTAAFAGCISDSATDDDPAESDENKDDGSTGSTQELPDYPYTGTPVTIDLSEQGYETTLQTVSARHEVVAEESKNGPVELPEVWAWKADDHEPSIPGPIYQVPEGEAFQIHYENTHKRPHTVHTHAVYKDWEDDGAPSGGSSRINPGESYTYDYVADEPGVHAYHCHVQTDTHLDMGMYGILHVIPEEREPVDKEYYLTLRDWDSQLHDSHVYDDVSYDPRERSSDTYTINGRSAPTTFHPEKGSPLVVEDGDRVRVHLVNAGYESHPFHTHGHRFEVVRDDGALVPEAARHEKDVVDVAPAQRRTIEFTAEADPGIYPAHCHKAHHVTTEGKYPGGMATAIVYKQVMDTEEFQGVMDAAGFEG